MHEYTHADLKRLFRLPRTLIVKLAEAGYITPITSDGITRYSFPDLLLLRTASALKAARISTSKITAALGHIRSALPPGSLLATLALAESGREMMVSEGGRSWEPHSGQYALPLAETAGETVTTLMHQGMHGSARLQAHAHYARGHALEDSDVAAARGAYLAAINAHSEHVEARINLGRLLHLAGEMQEAENVYRAAKISNALLSFNLAILLEDLSREEEAVVAYRDALAQDPSLHDAHFNLSRLHEQAQRPREALRHLLAYRRHLAGLKNAR